MHSLRKKKKKMRTYQCDAKIALFDYFVKRVSFSAINLSQRIHIHPFEMVKHKRSRPNLLNHKATVLSQI
jgi:hypothetical protein